MPGPKVHAIVVAHNGASWIGSCLQSLLDSAYPVGITVVDNASTDGTVKIVKDFPTVTCLTQQRNLGFGRANNIGIGRALEEEADYVFLLNQDACVHREAIGRLVCCAQENEDYGILSPLHLDGEGQAFDEKFAHFLGFSAAKMFFDREFGQLRDLYPVRFVNAAGWLVSAESLKRVGGFDPLFFMYGEDNDLCTRMRFHGYGIGVVPSAMIYHSRVTGAVTRTRSEAWRRKLRMMRLEAFLSLKNPSHSFVRRMLATMFEIAEWYLRFLRMRDTLGLAALSKAVVETGLKLPAIWKHRRIGRTAGAHWI